MKKLYKCLLGIMFLSLSTAVFAGNKDGRILVSARLNGAQEVPAVTTIAKGLVTFMIEEDYKTVTIHGVFDSLSGPVAACHFHIGTAGVSGGVTLDLFSLVKGNRILGKITLTPALLANIMSGKIYINVHTAANTGGEIRGQLKVETDEHYVANMSGLNEVPAITSTASGLGSIVISQDLKKLEYKILATNLTGAIAAAHLHYGAAGSTGAVVYPLSYNGRYLSGTIDISQAFLDSLALGKVYANIHTATNSGGEIRAQLQKLNSLGFDALALGANEVPNPVVTNAKAIAVGFINNTMDSITYSVMTDSLTSTIYHFHFGSATVAGGVWAGLTQNTASPQSYSGSIAVKADTIAKILRGDIYVNIHTTANPGGEIRGQLNTSVREGLTTNLCGAQEAPTPNAAVGIGAGMVSIDRNKTNVHVELVTNALTGNAAAGHIHGGAKAVSGPVIIGFPSVAGNQVSGFFNVPRPTFADSITNGLAYLNVHTAAFGGGEIRGQLGKGLVTECLNTAIFEVNGQVLTAKIFPNPTSGTVNIQFEAPENFDAQIIVSDLIGRKISTKNVQILRGSNSLEVDANQLTNGVYFIQMRNETRLFFTDKIVKN